MKRETLAILVSVTAFVATTTHAQRTPEGAVRSVDGVQLLSLSGEEGGPVYLPPVTQPGAAFLRLHFTRLVAPRDGEYRVVVHGAGGQALRYEASDLAGREDVWTGVVAGDSAQVEVVWTGAPPALEFHVTEVAYPVEAAQTLSVVVPDEREEVASYANQPELWQASRSVAKLSFVEQGVAYSCTGFLVADDLFLTNEHCVNSQAACGTAVAVFGYEKLANGGLEFGQQYRCARLESANYELDYALLRLDRRAGSSWGRLPLSTQPLASGQPVYVVGHPGGRPKLVSKRGCSVVQPAVRGRSATPTDFSHRCDTETGNSGSPVLNASHEVVGLHHLGFGPGGFTAVNRATQIGLVRTAISGFLDGSPAPTSGLPRD